MSEVKIVLSFDAYRYGENDPFKRKGGGWLTLEELQGRILNALERAVSMMDRDDQLTITIDVKSEET